MDGKNNERKLERPDITIRAPDPVCGGKYMVACRCGRIFDAWVDSLPYVQCPNCKTVVECADIKAWKRQETNP